MAEKGLENKKKILKKFDPALAVVAVSELLAVKRKEQIDSEKQNVEKIKPKIKEIYSSLPATEDRVEIISRALYEVNSEVVTEELKKIKAELSDLDEKDLLELAEELRAATPECTSCLLPELGCGDCIHYFIVACNAQYCVGYNVIPCPTCIQYAIITCPACIYYRVCTACLGYRVCTTCLTHMVCHICLRYSILVQPYPEPVLEEAAKLNSQEIDSAVKEKIVDAVVSDPRLSKAMRKLITEMKKKGEI